MPCVLLSPLHEAHHLKTHFLAYILRRMSSRESMRADKPLGSVEAVAIILLILIEISVVKLKIGLERSCKWRNRTEHKQKPWHSKKMTVYPLRSVELEMVASDVPSRR